MALQSVGISQKSDHVYNGAPHGAPAGPTSTQFDHDNLLAAGREGGFETRPYMYQIGA
jgi:hypothetical protein